MDSGFFSVEPLFEKKFSFSSSSDENSPLKLNFFTTPLWDLHETHQILTDFEHVRSLLNDKCLKSWNAHTQQTDLSFPILRHLRSKTTFELRTRPLLKFFEILYSFPVLDLSILSDEIKACYLCEAPGSFVVASHHYIRVRKPSLPFIWQATSFNPYYEDLDTQGKAITDDRFIREEKVFKNWYFGVDNVGDIMQPSFLLDLCSKLKASGPVDLVTGDGGINCLDNYENQEIISFPLHLHQLIVAINCLKIGGSFVLKLFNLTRSQTCCLMYVIYRLFERVSLFKPFTSKGGNSEVYAICLSFKGGIEVTDLTSSYIKGLESNPELLTEFSLVSRLQISSGFLEQFVECSRKFTTWQKDTILFNIQNYQETPDTNNRNEYFRRLISAKNTAYTEFFLRYPIDREESCLRLCKPLREPFPHLPRKPFSIEVNFSEISTLINGEQLSYKERKSEPKDLVTMLNYRFGDIFKVLYNNYDPKRVFSLFARWRTFQRRDPFSAKNLIFLKGREPTQITNSALVCNSVLHLFNLNRYSTFDCKANDYKSDHIECLENLLRESVKPNRRVFTSSQRLCDFFLKLDQNPVPQLFGNYLNIEKGSRLLAFDCYLETSKEFSKLDNYSLYLFEKKTLTKLVKHLTEYFPSIRFDDMLVLFIGTILTRLTAGVVYCLTYLFSDFIIWPFISDDNNILHIGQILILKNSGKPEPANIETFERRKVLLLEGFTQLFDGIVQQNSDCYPLEIFPFAKILKDQEFFDLVFSANYVSMVERMKSFFATN